MDSYVLVTTALTFWLTSLSLGQKLLQANIIFRHGDRSPEKTFPTDPYQESSWPRGWGQLLRLGMKRHLELGKFFKRRYSDLLEKSYHPSDIYVLSTDFDRTLMSAESNLAGMYPLNPNESWTTRIQGWQPLPIHTVPVTMDNLLRSGRNCPRYNAMFRELWTTRPAPEVVAEKTKYADFWRHVRERAGLPLETAMFDLWFVSDALLIEKITNKTLPDWVDEVLYAHLMKRADLDFHMMGYNETLARLSGGNLLNAIQLNMRAKLNGERTNNVYVYSAHDYTVATLLAALKVFNNKKPPYASAVMLELWEIDEKRPIVRVFYRNDTSIQPEDPHFLTVPGCQADCPWTDFLRLTRPSIPQNYTEECALPHGLAAESRDACGGESRRRRSVLARYLLSRTLRPSKQRPRRGEC